MSEHVFRAHAGLPSHMVVKLGWNAYSKCFFMAYLGEGSDDPHLWDGGVMHLGHDPAQICTFARGYTTAIPDDFAARLEADRRIEEEVESETLSADDPGDPTPPFGHRGAKAAASPDGAGHRRLTSLLPVLFRR